MHLHVYRRRHAYKHTHSYLHVASIQHAESSLTIVVVVVVVFLSPGNNLHVSSLKSCLILGVPNCSVTNRLYTSRSKI